VQTVWRWTYSGKLKGIKMGNEKQSRVLYKYSDIEEFMKKCGKII